MQINESKPKKRKTESSKAAADTELLLKLTVI